MLCASVEDCRQDSRSYSGGQKNVLKDKGREGMGKQYKVRHFDELPVEIQMGDSFGGGGYF